MSVEFSLSFDGLGANRPFFDLLLRACGAVGSASRLQREGQRFESAQVHFYN